MSNRGPFSHPKLEIAKALLRELKGFGHPDLENDYHAQRAACAALDRVCSSSGSLHSGIPDRQQQLTEWDDPE